jgi:hypothetical protein
MTDVTKSKGILGKNSRFEDYRRFSKGKENIMMVLYDILNNFQFSFNLNSLTFPALAITLPLKARIS